ncbi:MAG: putative molybdenum-pterin-binding protein [Promethearchaeota archaeon]|nr:MAG: putative molybdenum-pterin-binding protein [Candidatus Lokiarchaeota archaeon]
MPKTSARNKLHGVVKSVQYGTVTAEIVIELSGGQEVAAVITKKSAQELNLQEGSEVFAIIKATSVMVGKEH